MSRRNSFALAALLILGLLATGIAIGGGQVTQASIDLGAPLVAQSKGDPLRDMTQDMKTNHGKYDNALTALYEQQLAANSAKSGPAGLLKGILSPLYGVDVRISNGNVLGSNQNEFQ